MSDYHPIFTRRTADVLNEAAGVTAAQAEAMLTGSMVGWDAPGATPPANREALVGPEADPLSARPA